MVTRAPVLLRAVVVTLCLLGIFSASQRMAITFLDQQPDSSGLTPIVRANVETLARVLGIEAGTPRHTEVIEGSIAFERSYEAHPSMILMHVIPGGLILLLGPLQFSSRIRRRHVRYHRWAGRFLLVNVLLSAIAALFFGILMPFAGVRETIPIVLFGVLFAYSGVRAWFAIRERDVTTHREWMTRMFALAVGISVVRLAGGIIGLAPMISMRTGFVYSIWVGFGVSALAAEWLIRRARPKAARASLQTQSA